MAAALVCARPARCCPPLASAPCPAFRSDREKEQEIANLRNVGTATARRVGPVAARQLLQLLRSSEPDLRIREPKDGEAAGQA